MMDEMPENHIYRIDLGIDWSKCTKKETLFLENATELCDFELNALCNNRLAISTALENELAATEDPIRSSEIKDEVRRIRLKIEDNKRRGIYQDYGALKRRVAGGASADELYPMMPFFYAMTYDHVRRINARPDKEKLTVLAFLGRTTLLGVVANFITIKDSGAIGTLKELLHL